MKNTRRFKIELFAVAIMIGFITGCSKNKLIGTWKYSVNGEVNQDIYYTFKKNKKGSYTSHGETKEFTYEITNKEVTITYDGTTLSSKYAYVVENDILTIKDNFGANITYKK